MTTKDKKAPDWPLRCALKKALPGGTSEIVMEEPDLDQLEQIEIASKLETQVAVARRTASILSGVPESELGKMSKSDFENLMEKLTPFLE